MADQNPLGNHMQGRINNLFDGQDVPAPASLKEMEAMKSRIKELEDELTQKLLDIKPVANSLPQNKHADDLSVYPAKIQTGSTTRFFQTSKKTSNLKLNQTLSYALIGAAFGFLFPIVGTFINLSVAELPITINSFLFAQSSNPLLWIIDTAPIFLGGFAALAGMRQDSLEKVNKALRQRENEYQSIQVELEQRVHDRTHDLELASEVGRTISARVGNLSQLLSESVESIRQRFELYYTQVYLVDRAGHLLLLRAGTGDVGRQLLQRGHQLALNMESLNGRAALEKRTVIVQDTRSNPNFLPNPLLPGTRSEMAIPLVAGDRVVGVLDMQSEQPNALNEENLTAFETLAGQLAVAIQNSSLFEQVNQARTELEEQAKIQSLAGWSTFLDAVERGEKIGFVYNQNELLPFVDTEREPNSENTLHAPIHVAGAEIGKLYIADTQDRKWTPAEADIMHNTSLQLSRHIENLRLLAQSEKYRRDAEEATKRLTREGWETFLQTRSNLATGYMYDLNTVHTLQSENNNGHFESAITKQLIVRNETVGELAVNIGDNSPEEINDLITAVAEQLGDHIEGLRLLETTQNELIERTRAEKELLRVRLGMDRTNDAVFITETDGTIIYVNPAFERIYGWTAKEAIGKTPRILKSGVIPAEQYVHFWEALNNNKVVAGEIVNKTKDGRLIPIEGNNNPIVDGDGKVIGFLGMHRDITERKKAEETIAKAQEQYSLAVAGSNDGIWDWDIETNNVYFSPRWKAMVGYEENELMNGFTDFEALLHPEDHDHVLTAINDYLSGKTEEFNEEYRFHHKDGSYRWILARGKAMRREDGTPYRMAGSHSDITERKFNEDLIAQRANQLETVATVSTTASTVLNPDELLQSVVDLTKERFNLYHAHIYLADELSNTLLLAAGAGEVGRQMVTEGWSIPENHTHSIVANAARNRQYVINNNMSRDIHTGFLSNYLLPNTRSEMAIPMIVGDKLLGVFDVQADSADFFTKEEASIFTTLAAQVAVALQNARLYVEQAATLTQLRELDRLKSSFLANMSHELRTPLNSILGFTDVMLEGLDGDLTDYMDNDLRLIQKNGQHLLHLINDVLDMAKIESGRMNLHPEKFRVHSILDEVTSITSTLASEKNVALFIEPDSDQEIEIYADNTRLRQVMINLVNNAIKFTSIGKIALKAVSLGNSQVLISVKDTGLGIPPDKLEAVFLEFTQVDTSTTRKIGGTGLGLPISRRLVDMHGGRLWAESTGVEGEGSIFFVELPLEARITEVIEKQEK